MSLIFGLYHVQLKDMYAAINNAHSCGIYKFDTAELFRNEKKCSELCFETDIITTKIYYGKTFAHTKKLIKRCINRFAGRKVNMLLHKHMPNDCWKALCLNSLYFNQIGVCNYSKEELIDLFQYCDKNSIQKPTIHQIEIHPFVDCKPLIKFCQSNSITVQGHTVLTQGKFLNYSPLQIISEKYKVKPAQILVSWALKNKVEICVNSTNLFHLQELTKTVNLSQKDIDEIDTWHYFSPYCFYTKLFDLPHKSSGSNPINPINPINPVEKTYADIIIEKLEKDKLADFPSDLCDNLSFTSNSLLAKEIAIKMCSFVHMEVAFMVYDTLIRNLKNKRFEQTEKLSDPHNNLTLFFNYLSRVKFLEKNVLFLKGAIFTDGKVDLCKQLIGFTDTKQLCAAISASVLVKHLILSNNFLFQYDGERLATSFTHLIKNPNLKIKTWDLSNNYIDTFAIKILSNAFSKTTHCDALWLKNNPITYFGAKYINSMLKLNKTIKLLDLRNCFLEDSGVCNLLRDPSDLQTLKHLYLDSNNIKCVKSISDWCKKSNIVTLSLSLNYLADACIVALSESLQNNQTLKRLNLSNTYMCNAGLQSVVNAVTSCKKFICLDIGCKKNIFPGEWINFYDDAVVLDLVHLLVSCKSLKYLNVRGCNITIGNLLSLHRLPTVSMALIKGSKHYVHSKSEIKLIKNPKKSTHIESIYKAKLNAINCVHEFI